LVVDSRVELCCALLPACCGALYEFGARHVVFQTLKRE